MEKSIGTEDEIFELNVSGVTKGFSLSKKLLTSKPDTAIEAMFSGRHTIKKVDGQVILDRDPKIFRCLVNYLRNPIKEPVLKDEYEQ